MSKVVIAGGRYERLNEERTLELQRNCSLHSVTHVVTGGSKGIDVDAHKWAKAQGYETTVVPAMWAIHGSSAGPRRNAIMADMADFGILFPGGKGTANMEDQLSVRGKLIVRLS